MRFKAFVALTLVAAMSFMAYAELQNVEVGGSIRIRGNWVDYDDGIAVVGPFGGVIAADELSFVEQRTRLNVKADFTDEVSAFIELDSYDNWGEDFRSQNYVLGLDGRQVSNNDVEMYQAYIEAKEMWGSALRLRVGRQELSFGSEWLMGTNDTSWFFPGLSYDAIRLTYATDMFSVDAFAAKLAENMGDFGDDDVDLYGVYGSYLGFEDIVIDAYWLFVRDDTALEADLHTLGLRGAGTVGAFDFEAEAAYQFGDVDAFNDVDINAWALNLEAGYTFDMSYQPRVYAGFAYFEGGDGDDLAFNRLFSNWEYSEFVENTELSNAFVYRLGASIMPTECVKLALAATYIDADEVDEGGWWFWSWEDDSEVGLELGLYADYQYSEDLVFRAGYAHFFGDDGLEDGADIALNGLGEMFADDDDDDFNYLFIETELSF